MRRGTINCNTGRFPGVYRPEEDASQKRGIKAMGEEGTWWIKFLEEGQRDAVQSLSPILKRGGRRKVKIKACWV